MRLTNRGTVSKIGLLAATMLTVLLAGCSGNNDETAGPGPDDPAVTTTEATGGTSDPNTEPNEAPSGQTLADFIESIATEPSEAGPRPLLAWEPVAGAAEYQVVVLGADGEPYWAWSGIETMINVGGNPEPQAIGAWVHESMTWTVSAHSATGEVLGLSAPSALQP